MVCSLNRLIIGSVRWWLVTCLEPSHNLNQCQHIANLAPRNRLHYNLMKTQPEFVILFNCSHISCFFFQTNVGEIQPGYEDLVINVTDNFNNTDQSRGSSIITLKPRLVDFSIKFSCVIYYADNQRCVDTTSLQFKGKCAGVLRLVSKTRLVLECWETFGQFRSINPNMINHFASQSQTCQLFQIKMLNGPARHHRTAMSASLCRTFCAAWERFLFEIFFLPEASFGLRVLVLPVFVCLSVCVCVSIKSLSTR